MALVPLQPKALSNLNIALKSNNEQFFLVQGPTDLTGSVIDFSAWNTLAMRIYNDGVAQKIQLDGGALQVTGNSDGTLKIQVDSSSQSTIEGKAISPAAKYELVGNFGSSDAEQLLGYGTVNFFVA